MDSHCSSSGLHARLRLLELESCVLVVFLPLRVMA